MRWREMRHALDLHGAHLARFHVSNAGVVQRRGGNPYNAITPDDRRVGLRRTVHNLRRDRAHVLGTHVSERDGPEAECREQLPQSEAPRQSPTAALAAARRMLAARGRRHGGPLMNHGALHAPASTAARSSNV